MVCIEMGRAYWSGLRRLSKEHLNLVEFVFLISARSQIRWAYELAPDFCYLSSSRSGLSYSLDVSQLPPSLKVSNSTLLNNIYPLCRGIQNSMKRCSVNTNKAQLRQSSRPLDSLMVIVPNRKWSAGGFESRDTLTGRGFHLSAVSEIRDGVHTAGESKIRGAKAVPCFPVGFH